MLGAVLLAPALCDDAVPAAPARWFLQRVVAKLLPLTPLPTFLDGASSYGDGWVSEEVIEAVKVDC